MGNILPITIRKSKAQLEAEIGELDLITSDIVKDGLLAFAGWAIAKVKKQGILVGGVSALYQTLLSEYKGDLEDYLLEVKIGKADGIELSITYELIDRGLASGPHWEQTDIEFSTY